MPSPSPYESRNGRTAPRSWLNLLRQHLSAAILLDVERRFDRRHTDDVEVVEKRIPPKIERSEEETTRDWSERLESEASDLACELWEWATEDRCEHPDKRPDYCIVIHTEDPEGKTDSIPASWHSPQLTSAEEMAAGLHESVKSGKTSASEAYLIQQNRDLHGALMRSHHATLKLVKQTTEMVVPVLDSVRQLGERQTQFNDWMLRQQLDTQPAAPVPWPEIFQAVAHTLHEIRMVTGATTGPANGGTYSPQPGANEAANEPTPMQKLKLLRDSLTPEQHEQVRAIVGDDVYGDLVGVLSLADNDDADDDVARSAAQALVPKLLPYLNQLTTVFTEQQGQLIVELAS